MLEEASTRLSANWTARVVFDKRRRLDAALMALEDQADSVAEMAAIIVRALRQGNKVLVAGNGGSASEAQHLVGELVGRFKRERVAYAALALTADTSTLTAVANDYGYEEVFARQVEGLGRPGDVFVGLSTSGRSRNVLAAAEAASRRGLIVVALTGTSPNHIQAASHLAICVQSDDTPTIQEVHMAITHIVCDIVETEMTEDVE